MRRTHVRGHAAPSLHQDDVFAKGGDVNHPIRNFSSYFFVFLCTAVVLLGCTGNGFKTVAPATSSSNDSASFDSPLFDKPVYSDKISKLLNKHCNNCHRGAGGIAPFPLTSYQDVTRMAGAIKSAVVNRRMPPPGVDNSGSCETYHNAKWMSQDEINMLTSWIDGGMPQGDTRVNSVPPPQLTDLSEPKLVLTMPQPYTPQPPAGTVDDYRCFILDPQQTEDTLITGIQVLPQKASVVHHVIVFKPNSPEAQAQAEAKSGSDGRPGYTCFGSSGVPSSVVGLWAPGGNARENRDPETGQLLGLKLEKGRKLIMQVHYNTQNGTVADQSAIAVKFNTDAIQVRWMVMADFLLKLQPGLTETSHQELQNNSWMQAINEIFGRGLADQYIRGGGLGSIPAGELLSIVLNPPPARDMKIYAVAPHMHTLGTKLLLERVEGNKSTCLAKVPKFDFHWQGGAAYAKPVSFKKEESLRITCHFNTSTRTEEIKFGEGTEDEMCLAFLMVAE